MNSFYNKYIKYKNKYLNLKKRELLGGNQPSTLILKNINLFKGNEEKYLDPTMDIFGFELLKIIIYLD